MVDYAPRFSPDGREIVFTREVDSTQAALWIVGPRRIGTAPDHAAATSSEQGGLVARRVEHPVRFPSNQYPHQGLFLVRPEGSEPLAIALPARTGTLDDGYSEPAWSPDGSLILVVHGLHRGGEVQRIGLATVRPDGSELHWISETAVPNFKPDWGTAAC